MLVEGLLSSTSVRLLAAFLVSMDAPARPHRSTPCASFRSICSPDLYYFHQIILHFRKWKTRCVLPWTKSTSARLNSSSIRCDRCKVSRNKINKIDWRTKSLMPSKDARIYSSKSASKVKKRIERGIFHQLLLVRRDFGGDPLSFLFQHFVIVVWLFIITWQWL